MKRRAGYGLFLIFILSLNLSLMVINIDCQPKLISTIDSPDLSVSAPNIINITQDPITPSYQEDVNITAHITDSTQIQQVLIESNVTGTSDLGHYLGAYSFTNDSDGSNPAGWTVSEGSNTYVDVIQEEDGHIKVVEFWDDLSSSICWMKNPFSSQTSGTVEFWISGKAGTIGPAADKGSVYIMLCTIGETRGPFLAINWNNESLGYYNATSDLVSIVASPGFTEQDWQHIRINFNCTTDTFNIWVNGNQTGGNLPFRNPLPSVELMWVCTDSAGTQGNASTYIDAVDYSWAPGYYINRNMGDFRNISMQFKSGTLQDGLWEYVFTDYPINSNITYRILAQDLLGNWNASDYYSFGFWDTEAPNIINVTQDPVTPNYQEAVNITAHITDSIQIQQVLIESNVIGASGQGHYLGEYSFTNDTSGSDPTGWTTTEPAGTSISVVDNYTTHEKVVFIDDNSVSTYPHLYHYFSETSGAIECWFLMPDVSTPFLFQVGDNPHTNYAFTLTVSYDVGGITENYLGYWAPGGAWIDLIELTDDSWYHLRVTFECGAGGYDGLSAYTYNIYLNGTKYGTFDFYSNLTSVGRLKMVTYDDPRQPSEVYLDAVDFSWSPGYYPNRNLESIGNVSMLLKSGTLQDGIWEYIFTDYPVNTNITYRILAQDGAGNWNASDYYSFGFWDTEAPNIINVTQDPVTPNYQDGVNITAHITDNTAIQTVLLEANLSADGTYLGVYTFTNDSDGSNPVGWTVSEPSNTYVDVIQEKDGHKKVVELWDNSSSERCWMKNTFSSQISGTIEFWISGKAGTIGPLTDKGSVYPIFAQSEGSKGPHLGINWNNQSLGYYDVNNDYYSIIASPGFTEQEWHHIRINFSCTTDMFNIWVDGNQEGINLPFREQLTSLQLFWISTDSSSTLGNASTYIDAVDYSWAPGYYQNRNMVGLGNMSMQLKSGTLQDGIWEYIFTDYPLNTNITYRVLAQDGAGNRNASDYYSFGSWDTEAPNIINVTQDPVNPNYQDDVNITVHITDNTAIQTVLLEANLSADGTYLGVYSFTNDSDGSNPAGWTVYEPSNTYVNVIQEKKGHDKVVELWDNSSSERCWMKNTFNSQASGTVEFWISGKAGTIEPLANKGSVYIILCDSTETKGPHLGINWNNQSLGYYDVNTDYYPIVTTPNFTEQDWHHIRINFSCTTDTFNLWIDGNQEGINLPFANGLNSMALLWVVTDSSSTQGNASTYIDAVDYSWAPEYYLNRNIGGIGNISMQLKSGTAQDGIWEYALTDYPLNTNLSYRIYTQDVAGNWNASEYYSFGVFDTVDPTIQNLVQNPAALSKSEPINITVQVIENLELASVQIESNHTGSWGYYSMDLLNGSFQNGFWNYTFTNWIMNQSVWYRIHATDVAGRIATTSYNQFGYFPIIDWNIPSTQIDFDISGNRKSDISFWLENTGNTTWTDINITINLPANWTANTLVHSFNSLAAGEQVKITFKLTAPEDYEEGTVEAIPIDIEALILETGQNWSVTIDVYITGVIPPSIPIWVWIIIIVGSAAATTSFVVIRRRKSAPPKLKSKTKGKSMESLKHGMFSDFPGTYFVLSMELIERINSLMDLTEDERDLLIQYLNQLDEEEAIKFLDELKNIHNN